MARNNALSMFSGFAGGVARGYMDMERSQYVSEQTKQLREEATGREQLRGIEAEYSGAPQPAEGAKTAEAPSGLMRVINSIADEFNSAIGGGGGGGIPTPDGAGGGPAPDMAKVKAALAPSPGSPGASEVAAEIAGGKGKRLTLANYDEYDRKVRATSLSPEAADRLLANRYKSLQQGFMSRAGMAAEVLRAGDTEGATKLIKEAYNYVLDGRDIDVQRTADGKLTGQFTDDKTGEKIGNVFNLTPETITGFASGAMNPETQRKYLMEKGLADLAGERGAREKEEFELKKTYNYFGLQAEQQKAATGASKASAAASQAQTRLTNLAIGVQEQVEKNVNELIKSPAYTAADPASKAQMLQAVSDPSKLKGGESFKPDDMLKFYEAIDTAIADGAKAGIIVKPENAPDVKSKAGQLVTANGGRMHPAAAVALANDLVQGNVRTSGETMYAPERDKNGQIVLDANKQPKFVPVPFAMPRAWIELSKLGGGAGAAPPGAPPPGAPPPGGGAGAGIPPPGTTVAPAHPAGAGGRHIVTPPLPGRAENSTRDDRALQRGVPSQRGGIPAAQTGAGEIIAQAKAQAPGGRLNQRQIDDLADTIAARFGIDFAAATRLIQQQQR